MPGSIQFFKADIQFRFPQKSKIAEWINKVVRQSGRRVGALNFVFCTDKFLLRINKEFLKHDFYTDIITFDDSENDVVGGEIYISIDRVRNNSETLGIAFHDELRRVIIHGVLHLLGHKDKTTAQKKQMREKEEACLSLLRSST